MDERSKIECGVPIPAAGHKGGRWVMVLRSLNVGDSFRVGLGDRSSLQMSISHEKKRGLDRTKRFRGLTVFEDGEKWYRVWRVE